HVARERGHALDSIDRRLTTAMTGGGGWPMTVFLTPAGEPFYAGTYFPPRDRYNVPGFPRVIEHVARPYRAQGDNVARTVASVREFLASGNSPSGGPAALGPDLLDRAFEVLR